MKIAAPLTMGTLTVLAALSLTACAANEIAPASADTAVTPGSAGSASSNLSGTLVGAGASSQGAAQDSWITAFQTIHPQVTVNYDPSGSGAGREAFAQGGVAFAGSDRPFKLDEISAGTFASCTGNSIVEFPAYISPIAVVFNLDGITSLNLDAQTLAKIFSGQITRWNDPTIAAMNPTESLPDRAITAVHRSDKSGTTGNFTAYLDQAAPEAWTAGTIEQWPTEYGGEGAAQTSGVIATVTENVGTIGYADASRAADLGTIKVQVGEEFVAYTPEAAGAIVDSSPLEPGRESGDLAITLDRATTVAGVYPIVLVSYLIGCSEYPDAATGNLVRDYFRMVVSEAGQNAAAAEAGSAPLSTNLRQSIDQIIDSIK